MKPRSTALEGSLARAVERALRKHDAPLEPEEALVALLRLAARRGRGDGVELRRFLAHAIRTFLETDETAAVVVEEARS